MAEQGLAREPYGAEGMSDTGRSPTVTASWDDEAGVWVAESEDVPGLVTEAPTIDRLVEKLQAMIPEMLELNGGRAGQGEVPFRVVAERVARTLRTAA